MISAIYKRYRHGAAMCRTFLLAVPLLFSIAGPVFAGDVGVGQVIARKWCASCHLAGPGQKATDSAPSFYMMADRSAYSDARLRRWLFSPHPPMPDIKLTKTQTEDVIAYIRSLK
ncbi:MAG: hypothetical protein VW802_00045 [Rhodospirillaceae bacterium]|jgi:cytochrome c